MPPIVISPEIETLIRKGAIFYISHSGGKDSQAMYGLLLRIIPFAQIVVVHADLGRMEWHGVQDHIRSTISHPLNVVRAAKDLLEMVRHRAATRPDVPPWPSSKTRQCTSDLKRGPIAKFIRADLRDRGVKLAINVMGLRSQESSARASKPTIAINKSLSVAGRTVLDWLPIQDLTEVEVFGAIRQFGQMPFWPYLAGNSRLSCVFCVLGCGSDLTNGARHRPDLLAEYVALEEQTGWTMFNGISLTERIARAS